MKKLKPVFIILYAAAVAFLCVWQRVEIIRLGYVIAEAEYRLDEAVKESRLLRLEYSRTVSEVLPGDGLPEGFRVSTPENVEIIEVVAPGGSPPREGEREESR